MDSRAMLGESELVDPEQAMATDSGNMQQAMTTSNATTLVFRSSVGSRCTQRASTVPRQGAGSHDQRQGDVANAQRLAAKW